MENTREQKTPEQWFQMLREPYRSEAIANINTEYTYYEETTKSLKDAIQFSFDWLDSRQRHTYWSKIYNSIRKGETTYLEPETLKPEQMELLPEDLVSGEVYRAFCDDMKVHRIFSFNKLMNGVWYYKMRNYTGEYHNNSYLADTFKFYHATPEEKKLLLGEEEPTDWEKKYNELKAKYDQLEPKGEKVYFYFNRDMEKIEIAKSLDEAKINSEECHPIYEAYCIGKKKSVLVNE